MSWKPQSLGEHIDILSGFAFKSKKFNSEETGVPLIRIRDVVLGTTTTYYDGPYDDEFVVNEGDILIGMDGEFNCARWKSGPSLLNQRVCRITSKNGGLDQSYLFRFLPGALKEIEDRTPFATVKHLSVKDIRAIRIPLPPLDEQRRIAAILDQADDLRRKRREALKLLSQLEWSAFYSDFGPPQLNPKGFPEARFGDLIVDGPTNGLYKPAEAYGDGVPILRINNFYDGKIDDLSSLRRLRATEAEIRTYGLKQGDIVINRVNSREFLGKSALIPELLEPTVFESNIMSLRVDLSRLDPVFCIAFLQTDFVKRQITRRTKDAVNQSSINQSDVRSFSFVLPPLELQRSFADRIAELDKLKSYHRAHLTKLDLLFVSLQHRAFRGEL